MREKLAKCAFDLFAVHGFKDVNLDLISQKAGVTKGSLYWHYKSKHELIIASCQYYYDKWHKDAFKQKNAEELPIRQLESVIRMSTKHCLFDKKNRLFSAELFTLALHDAEVRSGWREFAESVRCFYTEILTEIAKTDNGSFSLKTPKQNVDWFLSTMEGIKQRAVFEPEICNPVHLEACVQMLLRIALGSSSE